MEIIQAKASQENTHEGKSGQSYHYTQSTKFIPPTHPIYVVTSNFHAPHISALQEECDKNFIAMGMQTGKKKLSKMPDSPTDKFFIVVDDSQDPNVLIGEFLTLKSEVVHYPVANNVKEVIEKFGKYIGLGHYQIKEQQGGRKYNEEHHREVGKIEVLCQSFQPMGLSPSKISLRQISTIHQNLKVGNGKLFIYDNRNDSPEFKALVRQLELLYANSKELTFITKIDQYNYYCSHKKGGNILLMSQHSYVNLLKYFKHYRALAIFADRDHKLDLSTKRSIALFSTNRECFSLFVKQFIEKKKMGYLESCEPLENNKIPNAHSLELENGPQNGKLAQSNNNFIQLPTNHVQKVDHMKEKPIDLKINEGNQKVSKIQLRKINNLDKANLISLKATSKNVAKIQFSQVNQCYFYPVLPSNSGEQPASQIASYRTPAHSGAIYPMPSIKIAESAIAVQINNLDDKKYKLKKAKSIKNIISKKDQTVTNKQGGSQQRQQDELMISRLRMGSVQITFGQGKKKVTHFRNKSDQNNANKAIGKPFSHHSRKSKQSEFQYKLKSNHCLQEGSLISPKQSEIESQSEDNLVMVKKPKVLMPHHVKAVDKAQIITSNAKQIYAIQLTQAVSQIKSARPNKCRPSVSISLRNVQQPLSTIKYINRKYHSVNNILKMEQNGNQKMSCNQMPIYYALAGNKDKQIKKQNNNAKKPFCQKKKNLKNLHVQPDYINVEYSDSKISLRKDNQNSDIGQQSIIIAQKPNANQGKRFTFGGQVLQKSMNKKQKQLKCRMQSQNQQRRHSVLSIQSNKGNLHQQSKKKMKVFNKQKVMAAVDRMNDGEYMEPSSQINHKSPRLSQISSPLKRINNPCSAQAAFYQVNSNNEAERTAGGIGKPVPDHVNVEPENLTLKDNRSDSNKPQFSHLGQFKNCQNIDSTYKPSQSNQSKNIFSNPNKHESLIFSYNNVAASTNEPLKRQFSYVQSPDKRELQRSQIYKNKNIEDVIDLSKYDRVIENGLVVYKSKYPISITSYLPTKNNLIVPANDNNRNNYSGNVISSHLHSQAKMNYPINFYGENKNIKSKSQLTLLKQSPRHNISYRGDFAQENVGVQCQSDLLNSLVNISNVDLLKHRDQKYIFQKQSQRSLKTKKNNRMPIWQLVDSKQNNSPMKIIESPFQQNYEESQITQDQPNRQQVNDRGLVLYLVKKDQLNNYYLQINGFKLPKDSLITFKDQKQLLQQLLQTPNIYDIVYIVTDQITSSLSMAANKFSNCYLVKVEGEKTKIKGNLVSVPIISRISDVTDLLLEQFASLRKKQRQISQNLRVDQKQKNKCSKCSRC